MLELQAVSKRIGSFALESFDLKVSDGEYFVLLGPSGVGKTVLLEVIAGLLPPDSGRILWRGKDITDCQPEARRFAVVYQDYALFPHMTVAGNIAYGLQVRKTGDVKTRVGALAEMFHIEPLLHRKTTTLSGGEQQRVALARALATEPELLLLDEPLAALDGRTRRHFRRELRALQRQSGTLFVHVTHDIDEALFLGDRVGVMLDTAIHQVSSPLELVQAPSDPEVADFLGLPNVLTVDNADVGACRIEGEEIQVASADSSVTHVWIKPEEIKLSRQPPDSKSRNQFRCRVDGWEPSGVLVAVRLSKDRLKLTALVTHDSFRDLGVTRGADIYCTFKDSVVHCL